MSIAQGTRILTDVIRQTHSSTGIGIPYPPIFRHDSASNYGYVDLKRSPARIYDISELQRDPELFLLVQSVNQPDSVFRTLGCNSGFQKAYVHIAFEVLHWNTSRSCYQRLISDYVAWQKQRENSHSAVITEFRICPASYWDHQFDGWAMSIHFEVQPGSQETITSAFDDLSEFLEGTSKALQRQLKACRKTISPG